jgi:glucoamylase
VQHRALREGATLASALGKNSILYTTQAENALCFLQTYWNGQYIVANKGYRSGIDVNTVLGSIHTFDAAAGCDATTFQPCSDKALANLLVYVDSFREVYPINAGIPEDEAVAVGRYQEDIYYNGNPWYLAVFAVAEQLYDALYVWDQQQSLSVTTISEPFFTLFVPDIAVGTYKNSSSTYKTLVGAIKAYADGFIAVNAKYTPDDGSLSEQFDKTTGVPTSAVHLTWSYASALTGVYTFQKYRSSLSADMISVRSILFP